jgi:hypothetical protein
MLSVFELIDISKIVDPETLELVHLLKLAENLKNTLNSSIDQLIENENINTQIETISLQRILNEVMSSIKFVNPRFKSNKC